MIIAIEQNEGLYKYTATGEVYYIEYFNANDWRLSSLENETIQSPRKLYIQTTFTTEGRIELITYIETL